MLYLNGEGESIILYLMETKRKQIEPIGIMLLE